jgi:hypothetical protein
VCETGVKKVLHENETRYGFSYVTVAHVKTKLISGFTCNFGAIRSRHWRPQHLKDMLNDMVLKLLYGARFVQIE